MPFATDFGGTVLSAPHILVVFVGPSWQGADAGLRSQTIAEFTQIVASAFYSPLGQYRRACGPSDITFVTDTLAMPPNSVSADDVAGYIEQSIYPSNRFPRRANTLYVAVYPPACVSAVAGVGGEHNGFNDGATLVPFAWIFTDPVTRSFAAPSEIFSHEVAESITDASLDSTIVALREISPQSPAPDLYEIADVFEGISPQPVSPSGVSVARYFSNIDRDGVAPWDWQPSIALSSVNDKPLLLLVTNRSGALVGADFTPGSAPNWVTLVPNGVVGAASIAPMPDGKRIDVVYRDSSNTVKRTYRQLNQDWSRADSLGGSAAQAPAFFRDTNIVMVAAAAADGSLATMRLADGTPPWIPLGKPTGTRIAGPLVCIEATRSDGAAQWYVATTGLDGRLWITGINAAASSLWIPSDPPAGLRIVGPPAIQPWRGVFLYAITASDGNVYIGTSYYAMGPVTSWIKLPGIELPAAQHARFLGGPAIVGLSTGPTARAIVFAHDVGFATWAWTINPGVGTAPPTPTAATLVGNSTVLSLVTARGGNAPVILGQGIDGQLWSVFGNTIADPLETWQWQPLGVQPFSYLP